MRKPRPRAAGFRGSPAGSPPTSWLGDARRLDAAIYAAIAGTETPALDRAMRKLSGAADYSKLWAISAAALAVGDGRRGRRAAAYGLTSIAVSATLVNVVIKPLSARRRPDRSAEGVPVARHVRMPISSSFPSGHAASAFAFASGVGHVEPLLSAPLRVAAAAVAYSRIHTGVHYLGDVLVGAFIGASLAELTSRALDRRLSPTRAPLKDRVATRPEA